MKHIENQYFIGMCLKNCFLDQLTISYLRKSIKRSKLKNVENQHVSQCSKCSMCKNGTLGTLPKKLERLIINKLHQVLQRTSFCINWLSATYVKATK